MIVGYKLNPITFFFLKLIIKIKYASLINIISNKEIIPEYIQSDFNVENVSQAIRDLLTNNEHSETQVAESQKVLSSIGFNWDQKPSDIAAKTIVNMVL
jgi:lipid-A-disaccharide synthase